MTTPVPDGPESPPGPQGRSVRPILLVSAALAALSFWALRSVGEVGLVDAALGTFLFVVVPALACVQVPLIGSAEIERVPAYLSSIVTLCFLGALCAVAGTWGDSPGAIGLGPVAWGVLAGWTALGTLVALVFMAVFRAASVRAGLVDSRLLRELLPRTPRERRLFGWLSLSAGVGEEVAYRGYGLTLLATVIGPWPAAFVTSGVFGVMHAYQGVLGVLRTGLLGLWLAAIFLLSGSLWPAVVAHTLLDLIAGLWLGERLIARAEDVDPRTK